MRPGIKVRKQERSEEERGRSEEEEEVVMVVKELQLHGNEESRKLWRT